MASPVAPPRASIVVVNYNGRELLGRCLAGTLEQARPLGVEVIVVDNASTDGSADLIAATFPEVRLMRNETNEGFAGGCNTGVRVARSRIIVLLNNDAAPRPGWLEELLRPLEDPTVAISCSVVYEARYAPAYELGTGSISVLGHPIPNVDRDPASPFYATGCALAFKRDVLGEPFDARYFAYYEDTLLSWRARLAGYRVARALGSGVDHLGSATARRQPHLMRYYWERNKLLTLLLCFEGGTLLRLVPLYLFDGLARVAEDVWHLIRRPPARPATLREVAEGYRATGRAVGWLVAHAGAVRRWRAAVQRQRAVPDTAIVPRLSGKIFDDLVPTPGHRVANACALAYCRLVGLRTAELAPAAPTPAGLPYSCGRAP